MMGIKEEERLHARWFNLELYRWHAELIPFIGAGFGVAPVIDPDGTVRYRPGYGIHNDYLFALEQGGLMVFGLFIAFLINCHISLRRMRRANNNEADKAFAMGMSAFFYALLVAMLPGQIF